MKRTIYTIGLALALAAFVVALGMVCQAAHGQTIIYSGPPAVTWAAPVYVGPPLYAYQGADGQTHHATPTTVAIPRRFPWRWLGPLRRPALVPVD